MGQATREVWVALLPDPEQVGLVEVESGQLDVEHLRRAIKRQFELDHPSQRIALYVPNLSLSPNEDGRFLVPVDKPLPPNAPISKFFVPIEGNEEGDKTEEQQPVPSTPRGSLSASASILGLNQATTDSEGQLLLPGRAYETALLVSFIRTDVSAESQSREHLLEPLDPSPSSSLSRSASRILSRVGSDDEISVKELVELEREVELLREERKRLKEEEGDDVATPVEPKEIDEAKEILLNLNVDLCSDSVQLSHEGIGEKELKALATILESDTHWTRLHVAGNHISTPGAIALAESLKENTNLQELDLAENYIGNEGATVIAQMLHRNKYLQEIDLSDNQIGTEGAKALGNVLKENKSLHEMNLSKNHIGLEGARALASMLKENKFLQDLDLSQNEIDAASITELVRALRHNKTLKHLGLVEDPIGDDGAKLLADYLKGNKTLKTLKLQMNGITSVGAKTLAENLRDNLSLQHLVLAENDIGDEGSKAIAQMLHDNHHLKDLHLFHCGVTDEAGKQFEKALRENKALQYLDLSQNKLSDNEKKRLRDAGATNPALTLIL